ncbi:MAG: DoxX family protein [Candidatus Rokuibacteriota bacterium]
MKAITLSPLGRMAIAAPVVLRVVTGIVMAAHGWGKLSAGAAAFGNDMLAPLGIPAPVVVAYLQSFAELIGGVFLVVGFLSRIAAVVETTILVLAILLVKVDIGLIAAPGAPLPGAELDLALIAGLVGVMLLGPGRPSVDHALGVERDALAATREGGSRLAA